MAELSTERADRLLAEVLPGRGPVRAVTRFWEGTVTGAFRIDAGEDPVVVKIYDSRPDAAKEAYALQFLTGHGLDISPRLLAYADAAAALDGRACVISALRPGRTFVEIQPTRAQQQEIYRQLGVVLRRLHAVPGGGFGYVGPGGIHDPRPDNSGQMHRVFEREIRLFGENSGDGDLADRLTRHVAEHGTAFAACARPAYCHGDVHEPNLLVDGDRLTGLLDPVNLHAGDPVLDFVRLDAFSMHGDATKMAGLLAGYGIGGTGWPAAWRPRIRLYRIGLALELYNWFTISGQLEHRPALHQELRARLGG